MNRERSCHRDEFLRNVELEPVDRTVDRGVSLLRVALDGGGGQAQAPKVAGQRPPLLLLLGGKLRAVTLVVALRRPPDRRAGRIGRPSTTGKRNAERDENQTPGLHRSQASGSVMRRRSRTAG